VYEVIRDTSPQAFTPALGPAATMISVCVLIFLGLVGGIFWLGGLVEKPVYDKDRKLTAEAGPGTSRPAGPGEPSPAGA
jgi:hypothetical protein